MGAARKKKGGDKKKKGGARKKGAPGGESGAGVARRRETPPSGDPKDRTLRRRRFRASSCQRTSLGLKRPALAVGAEEIDAQEEERSDPCYYHPHMTHLLSGAGRIMGEAFRPPPDSPSIAVVHPIDGIEGP